MTEEMRRIFPKGLVGIVYDCDGVMIDSEGANRFLYNTILGCLGLPALTDEQEKLAFQATFSEALKKIVPPQMHAKLDAACAQTDYARDILPQIKIMPGYAEFLEKAHKKGLRSAVDTNRTKAGIYRVLDFLRLPPYFNPVINCEEVKPKPSSEGAEAICRAWKAEPGQILFMGDSPDDMAAARGAGMVFGGFGGIKGDISVNTWTELANML